MHRNVGVDGLPAFILAAPGRDEEEAKRPAAGDTGLMLNLIIASLNSVLPNVFPSVCRYQYRIANAYSGALYVTPVSSKTRPTAADVDPEANKQRLLKELQGTPLAVALSPSASRLTPYLQDHGVTVIDVGVHPGLQAINGGTSNYKAYGELKLKAADDYVNGPYGKDIVKQAGGKSKLRLYLNQMRYHTFAIEEIFNRCTESSSGNIVRKLPKACVDCQDFHEKWKSNWKKINALQPLLQQAQSS
jgi:hypothetical protein